MSVEIVHTNNPTKLLAHLQQGRAKTLDCPQILAWSECLYLAENKAAADLLKENVACEDPRSALGLQFVTLGALIEGHALRSFPQMRVAQGSEELSLIAQLLRMQARKNPLARGFINRESCRIFQEILSDIEVLDTQEQEELNNFAQALEQQESSSFARDLLALRKEYEALLESFGCKSFAQVAASYFSSLKEGLHSKLGYRPLYLIELPAKLNQLLLSFIVSAVQKADVILIAKLESATSFKVYKVWEHVIDSQVKVDAAKECFFDFSTSNAEQSLEEADASFQLELFRTRFCNNETPSLKKPKGKVCDFFFPAGVYAQDKLLVEVLQAQERKNLKSVGIASSNPLELFAQIAPHFPRHSFRVQTRVSFEETHAGKLILAILSIVSEEKTFARDSYYALMSNPLLGVDTNELARLDTWVRQDRLLKHEDFLELVHNNEFAHSLLETLEAHNFEGFLDRLQERIYSSNTSSYDCSANLRALECVRHVYSFCTFEQDLHKNFADSCERIARAAREESWQETFAYPAKDKEHKLGCICIARPDQFLNYPRQSFNLLVLLNLNASDIPLKDTLPAHADLLAHLGRFEAQSELSLARALYAALLGRTKTKLIVGRVLADTLSNAEVPSIIYDDILEALGYDECPSKQICEEAGLHIFSGGEEDSSWKYVHSCKEDVLSKEHEVLSGVKPERLLSLRNGKPYLSPSKIEEYCTCPYYWFYRSRLRAQEIDEGCGPNTTGNFAHELLQYYYQKHLPSKGLMRIPANQSIFENRQLWQHDTFTGHFETYEACKSALLDDFNTLAEEMRLEALKRPAKRSYSDASRLAPLLPEDFELIESTINNVRELVLIEGGFAPQFVPSYFEWEFGKDSCFEFAGVVTQGKVDRIDICTLPDGSKRAIIIDYKSSNKKSMDALEYIPLEHFKARRDLGAEDCANDKQAEPEIEPCERHVPCKIQTLIYAQAVRKILGIEVVAALYVGIKDQSVRGASLPGVLSGLASTKNPPFDISRLGYDDFGLYVDNREADIAYVLEGLLAGDVRAASKNADACSNCKRVVCPVRDGESVC